MESQSMKRITKSVAQLQVDIAMEDDSVFLVGGRRRGRGRGRRLGREEGRGGGRGEGGGGGGGRGF